MLEFIDIKLITALIFLFMVVVVTNASFQFKRPNEKKEQEDTTQNKGYAKYYWFGYIAFLVMVVFFIADSAKRSAEENVKKFRGAKVLRCSTKEQQYRVSKNDGWEVDKYFFVKDSLMIRADKCEEM